MIERATITALDFMEDRPHLLMWTTQSNRTWTGCFPSQKPHFDLKRIRGIVDSGVFMSIVVDDATYHEGERVVSVRIKPDIEGVDSATIHSEHPANGSPLITHQ